VTWWIWVIKGRAVRLPAVRQERVELHVRGGVANACEDVGKVLGGLNAVGDAGADKRVESGEVPTCAGMSEEEIVVSGKGDHSQPPLRSVVVYLLGPWKPDPQTNQASRTNRPSA
jgi:hypothetical protein